MHTPDGTSRLRLIARRLVRPIARARSQLVPQLSTCHARHGPKHQDFRRTGSAFDGQHVPRQRLPGHQGAQVAGEVAGSGQAARLAVEVREIESPPLGLAAAVLAHQAVQPALDTAGQPEIRRVDSEHQGLVQHPGEEPVRQDQFDAKRSPLDIRALLPFVDPREAMQAPPGGLADGGGHRGGLQAIQGGPEALVVAPRCTPSDKAQDLVGCGAHSSRWPDTGIAGLDNLAGRPDQDIGIPDGGDTVRSRALHPHGDRPGVEVDGHGAPRLGQRKERIGHQVLGVADRHLSRQGAEQIELFPPAARACGAHHGRTYVQRS